MTKLNPNRRKHNSFSEFILNDDEIVMKLLLTIAKWVGPIILSWLGAIMIIFGSGAVRNFGIFFAVLGIIGWYKLYKFYKLGGSKNLVGLTASNMVWNKEKIIIKRGEKHGRGTNRQTKEEREVVR